MFKNNIIEKRVMKVVKERIAKAQSAYDTAVEDLEQKHDDAVEALAVKLSNDKDSVADQLVSEIFIISK